MANAFGTTLPQTRAIKFDFSELDTKLLASLGSLQKTFGKDWEAVTPEFGAYGL